ncbi:hypothetical protein Aduo_002304 [Ancylostoma duodenale]
MVDGNSLNRSVHETVDLFTDKRSKLWEEETNLATVKQEVAHSNKSLAMAYQELDNAKKEETDVRLEEAGVSLELRKVELAKAKLELERIGGNPPSTLSSALFQYFYYNIQILNPF